MSRFGQRLHKALKNPEVDEELRARRRAVIDDFIAYCDTHPDVRFWQAVYNWADVRDIEVTTYDNFGFPQDPFGWEDKDG